MLTSGVLVLQMLVGGMFLVAAAAKLLHLSEFKASVRGFDVVPRLAVRPVSGAIPLLEVLCGTLLITGVAVMWGLWLGVALVSVFLTASVLALRQGRGGIDCYCFGAGGQPLGRATIIRQIVILALLGLLVPAAGPIPLLSVEAEGSLIGFAGVVVFAAGTWAVAFVAAEFLRLRTLSQPR